MRRAAIRRLRWSVRVLPLLAFLLPVPAVAANFVEAVKATQLTGLENTHPARSPDGTGAVNLTCHPGTDKYMDRDHNHEICSMALDGVRSESGRNSEVF